MREPTQTNAVSLRVAEKLEFSVATEQRPTLSSLSQQPGRNKVVGVRASERQTMPALLHLVER